MRKELQVTEHSVYTDKQIVRLMRYIYMKLKLTNFDFRNGQNGQN
jgi:hypothetical protein